MLEHEAGARAGVEVLVDDGVGQAARPVDDRRRAIAQGDHLALAARLEAAGHHEQVAAGVDPASHRPVKALVQDDPIRASTGEGPERLGERRVATALDDEPGAGRQQAGRGFSQEVEALLRVEPADHAQDRAVVAGVEAHPIEEVGPAGRLTAPIRSRVRNHQVGVGRWVPDRRVDPVQDPEEARPAGEVELRCLPAQG